MAFSHRLRVRYVECDPQKVVFNANYLVYFDVAFTELWREAVGPWLEMSERGYDAVVADARLAFKAPAYFDDELDVALRIGRLGRSSIVTGVEVLRAGELLVEGELRHVVVSAQTRKSEPMPEWIRTGLQRFT
jgi:acyl-CoA thioester hydrolase